LWDDSVEVFTKAELALLGRGEAIFICSKQARRGATIMKGEGKSPQIGAIAPEFLIATPDGSLPLHQLAARYQKLVLTTQDSYRYHPN
jgi:hypothetical protein